MLVEGRFRTMMYSLLSTCWDNFSGLLLINGFKKESGGICSTIPRSTFGYGFSFEILR